MFQDCDRTIDVSYFNEIFSLVIQKVQNSLKKNNSVALTDIDKTKGNRGSNEGPKSKPTSARTMGSKGNWFHFFI